jgi:diguanylate cyclase (GGDEF)-like protein
LLFRAALSRIAFGATAFALLPWLFPRTREHIGILGLYLVVATVEQVLIARNFAGRKRAFAAGLVDLVVITYFIHLLGSTYTVFAAMYFLVVILNALVVGLRVGISLAVLNAIAYDVVVWLEYARRLPAAPDGPDATRNLPPTFEVALSATALMTVLLVVSTAVVGMLVTALRRHERDLTTANARLEDLSQRDPLTSLFNRRHLFARIEHELERVKRGHTMALVMLDLDAFKHINDGQGHLKGDLLLKEVADALLACTRVVDTVARYGGDEFMIVLPDTDAAQAHLVAERITESVRKVGLKFDTDRPVTASVGVAVATANDSIASAMRRADENAYRAKQSGGNRVVESA